MENSRAVSPPLPPDPRTTSRQSSPPKTNTSRDSVISDSIPLATPIPQKLHHKLSATYGPRPVVHQPEPQPIREAVDKAIDQSIDQSPTTSQLDPNLIAQITEAVVKNLVNANIGVATVQPASEPDSHSPIYSDSSIPLRYTPPSPHESVKPRDSVHSVHNEGFPLTGSFERETGTQYAQIDGDDLSSDDARPKMASRSDSRKSSRYATSFDAGANSRRDFQTATRSARASISSVASTAPDNEPTALEKAWQPLFDKDEKPTPRFGQLLRGLALHLINDFDPKASLVVTPAKLLRFFEETPLENEIYPWRVILGGSTSCLSISKIYRRLLCEHHFVQTKPDEQPNLPGLTPQGFETLMTFLIQAHPDDEYHRLSQAIIHMPISNADFPKERFPKELSRRLLPAKPNAQAEQRLIASMAHEPQLRLKSSTTLPPPPPPPPPPPSASTAPQQGPLPERQRMPYTRAPHSNAFDDDDLSGPSVRIERERKPYTARGGSGRIDLEYDQQAGRYREDSMPYRPTRQGSMSGSFSHSGTTPPEQRAGGRSRINTGPGSQPPLSYNNISSGRNGGRRSPPLSSSYTRSDFGVSDPAEQHDRYNGRRTAVSSTGPPGLDDDPRGKPIPLRQTQPTNSYDVGYGSSGMPPPLPPLGTSAPRQRQPSSMGSSYEDRRRSMYSTGPTAVPEGWADFTEQPANYPSSRRGQAYAGGNGANTMNH